MRLPALALALLLAITAVLAGDGRPQDIVRINAEVMAQLAQMGLAPASIPEPRLVSRAEMLALAQGALNARQGMEPLALTLCDPQQGKPTLLVYRDDFDWDGHREYVAYELTRSRQCARSRGTSADFAETTWRLREIEALYVATLWATRYAPDRTSPLLDEIIVKALW